MGVIVKAFKKFDRYLENFEKWFSGIGLLLITLLVLTGVFLRTFFSFTFIWLEEFCQYLMVWIVCFGSVLSVKNHEHVGVDVVFSVLPKKFLKIYRAVLALVATVFLWFFTQFSIDLVLRVKKTGQTSISMPWFKMYFLYIGLVIGSILLIYEYAKSFIRLTKDFIDERNNNNKIEEKNEVLEGGN